MFLGSIYSSVKGTRERTYERLENQIRREIKKISCRINRYY